MSTAITPQTRITSNTLGFKSRESVRYNRTLSRAEVWTGTEWVPLAGDAVAYQVNWNFTQSDVPTKYTNAGTNVKVDITELVVSVTPNNADSKVVIFSKIFGEFTNYQLDYNHMFLLKREIAGGATTYLETSQGQSNTNNGIQPIAITYYAGINNDSTPNVGSIYYIDSPNTTSEVTYTLVWVPGISGDFWLNRVAGTTNAAEWESGLSNITVEVKEAPSTFSGTTAMTYTYKQTDSLVSYSIPYNTDTQISLMQASIIPASTASRIKITLNLFGEFNDKIIAGDHNIFFKREIQGGATTELRNTTGGSNNLGVGRINTPRDIVGSNSPCYGSISYTDYPETTSNCIYTVWMYNGDSTIGSPTFYLNGTAAGGVTTTNEYGVSKLELQDMNFSTISTPLDGPSAIYLYKGSEQSGVTGGTVITFPSPAVTAGTQITWDATSNYATLEKGYMYEVCVTLRDTYSSGYAEYKFTDSAGTNLANTPLPNTLKTSTGSGDPCACFASHIIDLRSALVDGTCQLRCNATSVSHTTRTWTTMSIKILK